MTTTTIQFNNSGESQVFVAKRSIRNSDHNLGTIERGERVFFQKHEDGAISLLYAENGEPTNGNQYVDFASVADAESFANRCGLVDAE